MKNKDPNEDWDSDQRS